MITIIGGAIMGETFRTVQLSLNERYAHLKLNRPDLLNAMNEEMLTELVKAHNNY